MCVSVCEYVCVHVCPGSSRSWWIILWIRIFKRWRVFCLCLICHHSVLLLPSLSSYSLYLFLPVHILYRLRNHYPPIKVWTNTLPPSTLCVCMRVCERVLCLKSLNILKTETSFNYPLITLLITCHTRIHHWPDCTRMHRWTHSFPVHTPTLALSSLIQKSS